MYVWNLVPFQKLPERFYAELYDSSFHYRKGSLETLKEFTMSLFSPLKM